MFKQADSNPEPTASSEKMFTQPVRATHLERHPTAGFPPRLELELDANMEGTTNEVTMCIAQAPVQRRPGLRP